MISVKDTKAFREGVKVRYIGNRQNMIDAWGDKEYKVSRKYGDRVFGWFPAKYPDGSIHTIDYSINICELEVVPN